MTRGYFQLILSVNVFHSYFEQHVCHCLEFTATAGTQQILNRFGFKIRKRTNGFDLFSSSAQPMGQFFQYITQTANCNAFDFEINTNNPAFGLFTELPVNWIGELIYTSNHYSGTDKDTAIQLAVSYSENKSSAVLGKLTLNFDDILQSPNQSGRTSFDLVFQARATQWQYFVINKSSVQLDDPVVSGKGSVEFGKAQQVTTEAGESALLFSSGKHLIPLSEHPVYSFDLLSQSSGAATGKKPASPKVIVKGLPNPDPHRIGRVEGDEQQISSPMYIYL